VQNNKGKGLEPNRDKQKNEAQDALITSLRSNSQTREPYIHK